MAAHHVQTPRDENSMLPPKTKHAVANRADIQQRSPLADVSPNAKAQPSYANLRTSKPMAGSPLKRSFTAMTGSGNGFKYLKRRRLSAEETLGQVDGAEDSVRQSLDRELQMDAAAAARFRPGMSHADGPYYHQSNSNATPPSPTEPNTPPSDHGNEHSRGSSGDRGSFSSLINYDPSSQAHIVAQPHHQTQQSSSLVFKRVSHAETLMLRLRVAMYKVRTNQIGVPLEELRLEGEDRPWSAPPTAEEVVAERRRAAYLDDSVLPEPIPKLLPAPTLRPTAYSSRFVYDERPVPSSPPVMTGHDRSLVTAYGEADATPRAAARRSEWEKSSPPEEDDEASRSVKGSVAEGLLGLRNST